MTRDEVLTQLFTCEKYHVRLTPWGCALRWRYANTDARIEGLNRLLFKYRMRESDCNGCKIGKINAKEYK